MKVKEKLGQWVTLNVQFNSMTGLWQTSIMFTQTIIGTVKTNPLDPALCLSDRPQATLYRMAGKYLMAISVHITHTVLYFTSSPRLLNQASAQAGGFQSFHFCYFCHNLDLRWQFAVSTIKKYINKEMHFPPHLLSGSTNVNGTFFQLLIIELL